MTRFKDLMGVVVLVTSMVTGAPLFAAASPPSPAVERQTQTAARSYGAREYAAREAAGPRSIETFEGGGAGIYIGGSTAAIVLLVVLVVILL